MLLKYFFLMDGCSLQQSRKISSANKHHGHYLDVVPYDCIFDFNPCAISFEFRIIMHIIRNHPADAPLFIWHIPWKQFKLSWGMILWNHQIPLLNRVSFLVLLKTRKLFLAIAYKNPGNWVRKRCVLHSHINLWIILFKCRITSCLYGIFKEDTSE